MDVSALPPSKLAIIGSHSILSAPPNYHLQIVWVLNLFVLAKIEAAALI